ELVDPIIRLPLQVATGDGSTLPGGVVHELNVQLRENGRPTGPARTIDLRELPEEHREGQQIDGEMVSHEEEPMAPLAHAEQAGAKERHGREIERRFGELAFQRDRDLVALGRAEVAEGDDRQANRKLVRDDGDGPAVDEREARPQSLMTPDDL